MLFQSSALLDSMTVGENVGLGLRHHSGLDEEAIQERIKSRLALVGLSGLESLYPAELSGGMKKRVGWPEPWLWIPSMLSLTSPPPASIPSWLM